MPDSSRALHGGSASWADAPHRHMRGGPIKPPGASPSPRIAGESGWCRQYSSGVKGMDNAAASFHCFLNVCLQGCLHLGSLRRGILEAAHRCGFHRSGGGGGCMLCEVRYVVLSAQRTPSPYLQPDLVRRVLCEVSQGFRQGEMHDAVEAFGVILKVILRCVAESHPQDPLLRVLPEAPYYLHAAEFLAAADVDGSTPPLATLLRTAAETSITQHPCTYFPSIFPFHVVWRRYNAGPAAAELATDLLRFASLINEPVELNTIHPHTTGTLTASLRGFLAYYTGLHYTAFFRLQSGVWAHFDDRRVTSISRDWADVVRFLAAGKHLPVLLFYERDDVGDAVGAGEDEGWTTVEAASREESPVPMVGEVQDRVAGHEAGACLVM